MTEYKNAVPSLDEFSKNPVRYMNEANEPIAQKPMDPVPPMNVTPDAGADEPKHVVSFDEFVASGGAIPAPAVQPTTTDTAQPAGTDSILGSEAGTEPAATAVGPEGAEGTNPPAEKAAQPGAQADGEEGPLV